MKIIKFGTVNNVNKYVKRKWHRLNPPKPNQIFSKQKCDVIKTNFF